MGVCEGSFGERRGRDMGVCLLQSNLAPGNIKIILSLVPMGDFE